MKKKFVIFTCFILVLGFSGVANATYLLDLLKNTDLFARLTPLPEPGIILLMGCGLMGLSIYGRRKLIK